MARNTNGEKFMNELEVVQEGFANGVATRTFL